MKAVKSLLLVLALSAVGSAPLFAQCGGPVLIFSLGPDQAGAFYVDLAAHSATPTEFCVTPPANAPARRKRFGRNKSTTANRAAIAKPTGRT